MMGLPTGRYQAGVLNPDINTVRDRYTIFREGGWLSERRTVVSEELWVPNSGVITFMYSKYCNIVILYCLDQCQN